jgi:phosphoribosyl 1,2-cyclic phosphodiesterase
VRGSIPTPGKHTVKYGGNTTCHFLEINDKKIIIDAGSGIRELGSYIMQNFKPPFEFELFISHTHWDHIQGLPFFTPIYIPGTKINIYGPVNYADSLENIVGNQMTYAYFPVNFSELKAEFTFHDLTEKEIDLGNIKVKSKYLNHPVLTLGYRFESKGKVFTTCYDTEPYSNDFNPEDEDIYNEAQQTVNEMNDKLVNFLENSDLIIYDSQYTKKDFMKGWGHSTIDDAILTSIKANAKKMAIFHHDPKRTDDELEKMLEYAKKLVSQNNSNMDVFIAEEGLTVDL